MHSKYNYNKDYFQNIDTFEKAYWLGFITADGYVMDNAKKNNKSQSVGLLIRLSEEDKSHLEKLNHALNYNKPIKVVKNYGIYDNCKDLAEFVIYSRKIVDDLNNNGISSGNKSCNENIPNLNDELMKYFILGLFDGDGSISTEWSIVSSEKMVTFIKEFLGTKLNIKFQKISRNSKGSNLYRIRTSNKKNIIKLYEYFYDSNSIVFSLERKYNKIKDICEYELSLRK